MHQSRLIPLSLALSTFAAAQEVPQIGSELNLDSLAAVESLNPCLTRVVFDERGDGIIYARAKTWKGQFDATGATYVPFLGADAPRNFPVTFRLEGASVGGKVLPLASQPTVERQGNRIVIDHGPVHEIYDLSTESIEQSFVLPRRTAAGEVLLRLAVDSELQGQSEGRGLRFSGPEGGIHYGAAFAFDDGGREADVDSRLEGDTLELRVPAQFPIEGEGRLVIDPVISTFAIGPPGLTTTTNADIAFEKDVDGGVYLVVYELRSSANDTDVFSAEIVKDTKEIRNVEPIDISSDDWRKPRTAGNDGGNSFMIVCEVFPQATGGLSDIVTRVRVAGSSLVSLPLVINDAPLNQECFTPDIGGESLAFPGIWCVVWHQSLGGTEAIRAQAMSSTGSKLGFPIFLSPGGADDSEPTISESAGAQGSGMRRFNLAWTRRNSASDRDVIAAQIDASFTGISVATSGFPLGQLGDAHSPAVSSFGKTPVPATGELPWVVASVYDGSVDNDVIVQTLSGSQPHSFQNITDMEDDLFPGSYSNPTVGCAGNAFLLSYHSEDLGASGEQVLMNTMYLSNIQNGVEVSLAERRQDASPNGFNDYLHPDMATEYESGLLTSDEAMLVYHCKTSLGPAQVRGTCIEAFNSPAIGHQYCAAEYNSEQENGWLAMYGGQDTTTDKIALGSYMPPGQFTYLVCSQQSGSVFFPGGSAGHLCLGGQIGRLSSTLTAVLPSGTALFVVDPTQLADPSGPVAAAPGDTWFFQAWHRDSVGGNPTSNFTNAIRVYFE